MRSCVHFEKSDSSFTRVVKERFDFFSKPEKKKKKKKAAEKQKGQPKISRLCFSNIWKKELVEDQLVSSKKEFCFCL